MTYEYGTYTDVSPEAVVIEANIAASEGWRLIQVLKLGTNSFIGITERQLDPDPDLLVG